MCWMMNDDARKDEKASLTRVTKSGESYSTPGTCYCALCSAGLKRASYDFENLSNSKKRHDMASY
jgi:hypothetical protein